jgi:hypothetical protein
MRPFALEFQMVSVQRLALAVIDADAVGCMAGLDGLDRIQHAFVSRIVVVAGNHAAHAGFGVACLQ